MIWIKLQHFKENIKEFFQESNNSISKICLNFNLNALILDTKQRLLSSLSDTWIYFIYSILHI